MRYLISANMASQDEAQGDVVYAAALVVAAACPFVGTNDFKQSRPLV